MLWACWSLAGSPLVLPRGWEHVPFVALPDGVHRSQRDCTYFTVPDPYRATVRRPAPPASRAQTTLFGVACQQQMDSCELRGADGRG